MCVAEGYVEAVDRRYSHTTFEINTMLLPLALRVRTIPVKAGITQYIRSCIVIIGKCGDSFKVYS